MDPTRFDTLTKALGHARSRRTLLRTLGAAALGALGLAEASRADAASGGTSDCARFCATVFPPGPQRGACVIDATQGTGLCVACGGNPANYCHGGCATEYQTDPTNCGACGHVCSSDACHTAVCTNGTCGTAPSNVGARAPRRMGVAPWGSARPMARAACPLAASRAGCRVTPASRLTVAAAGASATARAPEPRASPGGDARFRACAPGGAGWRLTGRPATRQQTCIQVESLIGRSAQLQPGSIRT